VIETVKYLKLHGTQRSKLELYFDSDEKSRKKEKNNKKGEN